MRDFLGWLLLSNEVIMGPVHIAIVAITCRVLAVIGAIMATVAIFGAMLWYPTWTLGGASILVLFGLVKAAEHYKRRD